jgi:hypothetical protein
MKTPLILALILLMAGGRFAGAQDLGQPTSSTPYDAYLGPMRATLSSLHGKAPPLDEVKQYVRTGRSFRYVMTNPYVPQTPAETEATHAGDCKAKSLWVADKMDDRSVRFVVGKARAVSNLNHAWLLWKGPDGWLILDPTNYSSPIDANRVGPGEFIAFYSYTAGGKYVHAGAAARKAEAKYGDHT